ncbi:GTP-binding protein [Patescibacteria group bacterium]|nr:MAG: GTP-binding protein [Patescibacteria group bacterium]
MLFLSRYKRHGHEKGTVAFVLLCLLGVIFFGFVVFSYIGGPELFSYHYQASLHESAFVPELETPKERVVQYVPTPSAVKGIYMTGWIAGSRKLRQPLLDIIDTTEINSVVIDIKDYTGRISFAMKNDAVKNLGSSENRITDIEELIDTLHAKGVYVIGRISSFQDAYLVAKRPELAVRRKSDGGVWKDTKGISWLDPGSTEVWNYLVDIGTEAHKIGFDELNFDYIRFPSDGNMKDIAYPYSKDRPKPLVIKDFNMYVREKLGDSGAVLSADLFGMTTTNKDDLNIGQVLENALPYFDYVAPMVYPSHYPTGFNNYKNPAQKPYEVVKYSMDKAVARAVVATTSPLKLRPWLQDFSLGAIYTPEMVRAQIQATYDSGLTSWLLWNASNRYTVGALEREQAHISAP